MKIWAVANQKGGVGKTTTVVSLAGALANRGEKVLLVDLDPHASLSSYLGLDPDATEDGTYALFRNAAGEAGATPRVREAGADQLPILPASPSMAVLDRKMGTRKGMGLVLYRGLHSLEGDWDHVLLDCPPMLGILMVNALAACDFLVIPVQTEFLALNGLRRMLSTLEMIGQSRGRIPDYRIVPTQFDQRTRASRESLENLRAEFGAHLWNGIIPVDTRFRDASRAGRPLPLMSPSSRGSRAYEELLDELLSADGQPAREAAS